MPFHIDLLFRLSKHVLSAQDTGSFLAITLGLVLVKIKRNFDRFMEAQKRSIEEARAPRRNKCGILPFVSNFEKFSDTTETIFKSSERRSDLEKWYTSLVMEMVSFLRSLALRSCVLVIVSREKKKNLEIIFRLLKGMPRSMNSPGR